MCISMTTCDGESVMLRWKRHRKAVGWLGVLGFVGGVWLDENCEWEI